MLKRVVIGNKIGNPQKVVSMPTYMPWFFSLSLQVQTSKFDVLNKGKIDVRGNDDRWERKEVRAFVEWRMIGKQLNGKMVNSNIFYFKKY